MNTLEALRAMLDRSGVTPYQAAKDIGRGSSFVSSMFWRGSVPSADLLAKIAGVCGYKLVLTPADGAGDSLTIDGGPDG